MFLGVYEETGKSGIKRSISFECSGTHILERFRERCHYHSNKQSSDSYVASMLMGILERELLNEDALMYVLPEISKDFLGEKLVSMGITTQTDRYVSPSFVFFDDENEGFALEVIVEQTQITSKTSATISLNVEVFLHTYLTAKMFPKENSYVLKNTGNNLWIGKAERGTIVYG